MDADGRGRGQEGEAAALNHAEKETEAAKTECCQTTEEKDRTDVIGGKILYFKMSNSHAVTNEKASCFSWASGMLLTKCWARHEGHHPNTTFPPDLH